MHIKWNTVTWYSKLLAVILFVAIFAIGLCLGMQIQLLKDTSTYYRMRAERMYMYYHPIDTTTTTTQPATSSAINSSAKSATTVKK